MWPSLRLAVASVLVCTGNLGAQMRTPVTGSMVYNVLRFSPQDHRSNNATGFRFFGRIALPLTERLYVGFGVGSWVRYSDTGYPNELSDYSEAVNHTGYVQLYLWRSSFLRAGAGFARTTVLSARDFALASRSHTRTSWTTGAGVDLPLRPALFLTLSLDQTWLPSVPHGAAELRWTTAYGVGLTIR